MTSPVGGGGGGGGSLEMCVHVENQVVSNQEFLMNSSLSTLDFEVHTMDVMDSSSKARTDMPPIKASDREARILAEKLRRSQYNSQITQMTALVSDVVQSQRKVDKTSVLRLAANKLRNEHVFGDSIKCCHVETWSSAIMKFFDLLGGVLIGITCRGRIFNVSPNIQEKLGYCHVDLLGQDFYSYVHPEDKEILSRHIYPPELQNSNNKQIFEKHHEFKIRILRSSARSDPPCYEFCRIDGKLRRADRATASVVQDEQIIRRQRVRHNRTFSSSGNDIVFIGMIHIISNSLPAPILPPTAYSEYWTRHLLDGRIVQCDQSISLVTGYMTDEVTGTSAFVFMHKDDVRWVICVLRQMYDQSKEFGESYYRLMSRSGHFVYMRTRGFLEIDRDTRKIQSFVCVNSIIGEACGQRMMEDMKRKYSVIVDEHQNSKVSVVDEVQVEHPKQLERIVMHLLEPSVSESSEQLKLVAPSKEHIITAIKNSEKVVQETGVLFDSRKRKIKALDSDENSENLKRHSGLMSNKSHSSKCISHF